jgi:signal transduction histidine kinase
MRERAEELGGRLEVTGSPGAGTRVTARLPVDATRTAGAR